MSYISTLVAALPASSIKNSLLSRCGHSVSSSSIVGPILLDPKVTLILGPLSRVGPFNVVRGLNLLEMGPASKIGQWNWISSAPDIARTVGAGSAQLTMGQHSALTSRHYIDATGGIEIGDFATVAGVRSTFISHGIDTEKNVQTATPIKVGPSSLISSSCKLTPGSSVPANSVIGMGSVITRGLTAENFLYAGTPAVAKKRLVGHQYFDRTNGVVNPAAVSENV